MHEQFKIPRNFIPPVRLVAFYMPQFHPIPENDLLCQMELAWSYAKKHGKIVLTKE